MPSYTIAIILISVLVPIVAIVVVRKTLFGQSKAKQEQAAKLMATGAKARAMITGVQPTGMVVNNIYLRSVVTFRLEPLDGSPPFDGSKTVMLAQTNMPRVGDRWPSWYDPSNPSEFAVAQVNALTTDQIPLFREFGIPHPLDTDAAATDPDAASPVTPPVTPPDQPAG